MKMKKLIGLILIVLFAVSCKSNNEVKGTFVFNPEKPKVGEEITIKYNAVNTDLGSAPEVDAVVYSYSTDIEEAKEIYLSKKRRIVDWQIYSNKRSSWIVHNI